MVVRRIMRGLPGTKRSTSASIQQAICMIRSAAMHTRKDDSLAITKESFTNGDAKLHSKRKESTCT